MDAHELMGMFAEFMASQTASQTAAQAPAPAVSRTHGTDGRLKRLPVSIADWDGFATRQDASRTGTDTYTANGSAWVDFGLGEPESAMIQVKVFRSGSKNDLDAAVRRQRFEDRAAAKARRDADSE